MNSFAPEPPDLSPIQPPSNPDPVDWHVALDFSSDDPTIQRLMAVKRNIRKRWLDYLFQEHYDPDFHSGGRDLPPEMAGVLDRFHRKIAVLTDDPASMLKIAWHPHFQCWALWSNVLGLEHSWKIVTFWTTDPTPERISAHLLADGRFPRGWLRHLAGLVGAPKEPSDREIDMLLDLAFHENTDDEIETKLWEWQRVDEIETEKNLQGYERDVARYYFNMFNDEANGGTKQRSMLTTPLPEEQSTHVEVVLNGITMRAKRGTKIAERLLQQALEQAHADQRAAQTWQDLTKDLAKDATRERVKLAEAKKQKERAL